MRSTPPKLDVLMDTWNLTTRGAASRARQDLRQRAARLARTPHRQAAALEALTNRVAPVIRAHGVQALAALLAE